MKFSIIIPVHNQFNLLDQCLHSIIDKTTQNYEIVLSDSGSNRKLAEYYSILDYTTNIKNLHIIEDNNNPGFSRAINNGMKVASDDSDYYVWLNSDTVVTYNWLSGIENQDLCSPVSNHATYQTTLQIDLKDLHLVEQFLKTINYKNIKSDFLNGFCYIISKKVFQKVGFLDEIHFLHYGSEDDYSLRAKLKGFQSWILPNNYVYHVGNQSYQSTPDAEIRKTDKTFLSRYPKNWFDNLITRHTVKTRNLRSTMVEDFLTYLKELYDSKKESI